ncbi:protein kinase PINOID-like [Panicum miliaceum]|uniref:non-specific serine/threonine protein kinase n=1 Tax=Panicum miliaceum TaxID=4540 RepID=A0A3L6TGJ4_PANMI|nr:protein kinase PINOID-like [Panicum miliaceum]
MVTSPATWHVHVPDTRPASFSGRAAAGALTSLPLAGYKTALRPQPPSPNAQSSIRKNTYSRRPTKDLPIRRQRQPQRYIMPAPASSSATAAAAPASSSPPKPPNNAASTISTTMLDPQSSPYPDAAAPAASSVSSASTSSTSSSSSSQADRSSTFSLDSSSAATPSSSPPRPHRASDVAWAPIRGRALGPRDFTLLRRVGAGDIGTVYLCRLEGGQAEGPAAPACTYAMKVVDRRALARKGKLGRAAAEKRVLRRLDHPFLPTMFADFDAGADFSCIVMEFCPGGDLHSLRHRMPGRRFPLASGGDKKGEPAPTCLPIPELQLLRLRRWKRRAAAPRPRFVAEPVDARSSSFVGTHEYVAPEVARGGGHGAAVDWWAYGVFLYELIYGRTPFVGETNEATLRNIVRRPLEFPAAPAASHGDDAAARDLIARLLDKDPRTRLGSRRGAADVKAHGFFKGLNLALLRSSAPPVVPPPAAPLHRCDDKAADVQQLFDHF